MSAERLAPWREGQLREFAAANVRDMLPVFEELVAVRTELNDVRWRASESEKAKDVLAALLTERTRERDTARRLAGHLRRAALDALLPVDGPVPGDHETLLNALGRAARDVPQGWETP